MNLIYRHNTAGIWFKTALVSLALSGILRGADGDPKAEAAPDRVSENEETVVIGGAPTPGWPVLPASETEYRFKLKVTGDVITLRWADLDESERKRVQKIYKMEVFNGQKVFGEKIQGVRYKLKSGKTVEGFPLPEREQNGKKAIKTAGVPLMLVPEYDIEATENFEAYESDFFSPMEIYQKWLLDKAPGTNDAVAHFAMAQKVANIGLFGKAIDHLKMAAAIDPKMEERNKDFYAQLVSDDAKQRVMELYTRMITAKRAKDYGTAFYLIDQLDRNFPNSDVKSRWEAMRPEIEMGMKSEIVKRIVQMSYTVAMDLLHKKFVTKVRVDDKNNLVASIPGKQVTTRHGHILRGTLDAEDATPGAQPAVPVAGGAGAGGSGSDIVLKIGNTKVTIKAKEIVSVQDVDLSIAAKEITPAFDDLKDYVTDVSRPDGLKMQMIAKISQLLREPEARVKEIFDARLKSDAIYDEDGKYTKSPVYVTLQDAHYGTGSWLREGSRPATRPANMQNNQPRRQGYSIRGGNIVPNDQNGQNGKNQPPDPQEDPTTTDDPQIWWKSQSNETQINVLRAMAAEKVFTAKDVIKAACSQCRNTGQIAVTGKGGNIEPDRCPMCRGIGVLFKIIYY